ncbi:MAG: MFS transporter, partial [Chloroflexota bacterium]
MTAIDNPLIAPRPTRVRWVMFALACAVSWLLYLHRYSWGVIKPYFRRENPDLTDSEVGWLDAAFNAAYALGQVPSGLAGDRYGPRGVLAAIILCWSVAVAGVAWTTGFWRLGAVRATFGLAQAGGYPVIAKMTRSWFPLEVRTAVQGVVASCGRIGAACAPLVIAYWLMGRCGLAWQTTLLVIMAPGIVLAVGCWLLMRNSPPEHPRVNAAEQALIDGPPLPASGPGRHLHVLSR